MIRWALRIALVVLPVGGWMALTALPAAASDLESYLQDAEEARYSGRQVVLTVLDGESTAAIYDISHDSSTMRVNDGAGDAMVGEGKVQGDGPAGSVEVTRWSAWRLDTRYQMGKAEPVVRLGRDAEQVEILEHGALRARIVIDLETAAPLATEVYDGDGDLFRFSAMLAFTPEVGEVMPYLEQSGSEYELLLPAEVSSLPDELAGYRRADSYAGPDDAVHAFYSDGLFSFSVFEMVGRMDAGGLAEATRVDVAGLEYRRMVNPGEVWVYWVASEHTYVLVGDLPPDHLAEVLQGLPRPQQRSFLGRLWHGLFG